MLWGSHHEICGTEDLNYTGRSLWNIVCTIIVSISIDDLFFCCNIDLIRTVLLFHSRSDSSQVKGARRERHKIFSPMKYAV